MHQAPNSDIESDREVQPAARDDVWVHVRHLPKDAALVELAQRSISGYSEGSKWPERKGLVTIYMTKRQAQYNVHNR